MTKTRLALATGHRLRRLLRSLSSSFLSVLIAAIGLLLALPLLDLTHIVLSIVGLVGIAGLALGFAFRDIAENFVASILLGTRGPLNIGDCIQVAANEGVVKTLNTRATVLVTLDGNHVSEKGTNPLAEPTSASPNVVAS